MTVIQNVPQKKYRLPDGELGTEWEALHAVLTRLEANRLHLDEKIELTRRKMQTAEGAPRG